MALTDASGASLVLFPCWRCWADVVNSGLVEEAEVDNLKSQTWDFRAKARASFVRRAWQRRRWWST